MLRTVNDQLSLWDAILPAELLVLPGELARVDELLDDPAFFAPFVAYFDPRIGRPSVRGRSQRGRLGTGCGPGGTAGRSDLSWMALS